MRDYTLETKSRVEFIQNILSAAHAKGIVFGNSGGKDSALVGVLCKKACENTLGLILPCGSKQNYASDKADAEIFAKQFNIATRIIDIATVKEKLVHTIGEAMKLSDSALINIAPRLRMTTLYAIAASENRLVAGTGNRSERYMGYFTKWGDGAFDFNPISDLTVTEIYEFLRFLDAPDCIINKAPSAGLFDGQTDEKDMGITYHNIDNFLLTGSVNEHEYAIIQRFHQWSEHKRESPLMYGEK